MPVPSMATISCGPDLSFVSTMRQTTIGMPTQISAMPLRTYPCPLRIALAA